MKINKTNLLVTMAMSMMITMANLFLFAINTHAQTYRWVDENGTTHFSTEPPPEGASTKKKSVNANLVDERDEYKRKRSSLENQISITPDPEKRERLKRQLIQLDISWYEKYNPQKAEQLKASIQPKIRVIKKQSTESSEQRNMKHYKAFY